MFLEERVGIEITEDEMGFLAAYFGVFLLVAGTRRETMQDRDRLRIWKDHRTSDRESVKESL